MVCYGSRLKSGGKGRPRLILRWERGRKIWALARRCRFCLQSRQSEWVSSKKLNDAAGAKRKQGLCHHSPLHYSPHSMIKHRVRKGRINLHVGITVAFKEVAAGGAAWFGTIVAFDAERQVR